MTIPYYVAGIWDDGSLCFPRGRSASVVGVSIVPGGPGPVGSPVITLQTPTHRDAVIPLHFSQSPY